MSNTSNITTHARNPSEILYVNSSSASETVTQCKDYKNSTNENMNCPTGSQVRPLIIQSDTFSASPPAGCQTSCDISPLLLARNANDVNQVKKKQVVYPQVAFTLKNWH
ncbi:hypothetical protein SK128_000700 [Halocaridina rubra]|uniref:Uncharacterized protein n=1 Tax=Halocaridina rubra TaxID=373956 RepID=A0AAN8XHD6_HALRR